MPVGGLTVEPHVATDLSIEVLISSMRANLLDLSAPPAEVRKAFSAVMGATRPVGADQGIATSLGGITALRFGTLTEGTASVLYLHGGGYVFGSAEDYSVMGSGLANVTQGSVWAVDYRLAPEHPYPCALDDAFAAYTALVESCKDPATIALVGDSAGGGLAISLLMRARDSGVAMPGALVLLSPWVDLECQSASMQSKAAEDPSLSRSGLAAMARHYLSGSSPGAVMASPLNGDFSGFPPALVQVGSREILLDDALRVAAAAGSANVSVRLEVWPLMIHVWQAFAPVLREGRAALSGIGEFIRTHCEAAR